MANPVEKLPVSELRKFVRLDPATGELFWLPRPSSAFAEGGRFSAESKARQWNGRFAGKPALHHIGGNGYRHGKLLYGDISAHRVVLALVLGRWPTMVDHIDGNPLNNRPGNLREVSRSGNGRNLPVSAANKSGVPGVCQRSRNGKWIASIRDLTGKRMYLGEHATRDDAVAARKRAEPLLGYHENNGRLRGEHPR